MNPETKYRGNKIPMSVATGLVLALALGLAPTQPAAAAGGIAVSPDGVTYAAALPGGLFDQITISVPGDSQTTEFWIRN